MKKLLIVMVAFCATLASCQSSTNMKSYSGVDSLSYAFGIDIASQIRGAQDSSLNAAVISAAIKDVFAGKKTAMTRDEAYAFLNEWFSVREPARLKAESKAWLDEVKASNPKIQTTASGLMYEIVSVGDANVKATNDADKVVVTYRGTYKDGSEFDANENYTFALNGVIPAWTEGMKLIGKGGQIILWANPDLAYFPINGNPAAMKFEVTLHDVIPAPAAE